MSGFDLTTDQGRRDWVTAHYPIEEALSLLAWHMTYRDTGNPLPMLQSFILAWELGGPLPPWVSDYFGNAINRYMRSDGSASLDELLGLRVGPGQPPWLKAMDADTLEEIILHRVLVLRELFSLTVGDACRLERARLDVVDWPLLGRTARPRWTMDELSIARRWSNDGKVVRELFAGKHDWTDEQRREFLAGYPRNAVPAALKKKYLSRTTLK